MVYEYALLEPGRGKAWREIEVCMGKEDMGVEAMGVEVVVGVEGHRGQQ